MNDAEFEYFLALESEWSAHPRITYQDEWATIQAWVEADGIDLVYQRLQQIVGADHRSRIDLERQRERLYGLGETEVDQLKNAVVAYQLQLEHSRLKGKIRQNERHLRRLDSSQRGRITDAEIQQAREYPIEDLVEGQTRRSHNLLLACCPFHQEKTPSFTIYPDNHWHCFGCGVHGLDAIDYVMLRDNCTFIEAVRRLL